MEISKYISILKYTNYHASGNELLTTAKTLYEEKKVQWWFLIPLKLRKVFRKKFITEVLMKGNFPLAKLKGHVSLALVTLREPHHSLGLYLIKERQP